MTRRGFPTLLRRRIHVMSFERVERSLSPEMMIQEL
jgi:hypothetical protein